jgi:serine-type D-Ala-D-Ala carboxypeptidase (penicillin-binding protein 5/6)
MPANSTSVDLSPLLRRALTLCACALAVALAGPATAATAPPDSAARAVLVADGPTGEVLYAENAGDRLAPASLTKLMTALVVLDWARPNELVRVSASATSVGESSIRLVPGERLRVRDLLAAALIQSANDAAYALAVHVGDGDVRAFVRLMNAKADELGLDDTHFVRPDGLDTPGHYSSARDLLALARAAMQRPLIRSLVRLRGMEISGGRSLFAWNDLLGRFPGLIGIKTGHTEDAGWCQVAAARRDGVTTYAVILGSPGRARRNEDLAELLEWGLAQYARVNVVHDDRPYATAAVPFSDERLSLVPDDSGAAVVRLGRPLVETVTAPALVELPVERGEQLGEIVVSDGRRVLARRPLVAAEAIGDPGLGERAGWYADRALDEAGGILTEAFGALL